MTAQNIRDLLTTAKGQLKRMSIMDYRYANQCLYIGKLIAALEKARAAEK